MEVEEEKRIKSLWEQEGQSHVFAQLDKLSRQEKESLFSQLKVLVDSENLLNNCSELTSENSK
jgi:hypothetical protein